MSRPAPEKQAITLSTVLLAADDLQTDCQKRKRNTSEETTQSMDWLVDERRKKPRKRLQIIDYEQPSITILRHCGQATEARPSRQELVELNTGVLCEPRCSKLDASSVFSFIKFQSSGQLIEYAPVDQESEEDNVEGGVIEHNERQLIEGNMAMASPLDLPPPKPFQILQGNTSLK